MIPALIGLRAAIDQAIEVLGPLEPVIAAWEAAQEAVPAPSRPLLSLLSPSRTAGARSAPDGPPGPTAGLFDPLPVPAPAKRRPTNGASSTPTGCERCGAPVEHPRRGARRRYCGPACRVKAKAARLARREADPGLELRCRIGSLGRSRRSHTTTTPAAIRRCCSRRHWHGSSRSAPRPDRTLASVFRHPLQVGAQSPASPWRDPNQPASRTRHEGRCRTSAQDGAPSPSTRRTAGSHRGGRDREGQGRKRPHSFPLA
jgi:hypothetical protein